MSDRLVFRAEESQLPRPNQSSNSGCCQDWNPRHVEMETLQLSRPTQEFYGLSQVFNNVAVFKKGHYLPQVNDREGNRCILPIFLQSNSALAQTSPNPSIKTRSQEGWLSYYSRAGHSADIFSSVTVCQFLCWELEFCV